MVAMAIHRELAFSFQLSRLAFPSMYLAPVCLVSFFFIAVCRPRKDLTVAAPVVTAVAVMIGTSYENTEWLKISSVVVVVVHIVLVTASLMRWSSNATRSAGSS